MDNNKCLLLEFINEDKKIVVGYQDWLQDKISGKEEYLNIIKKKSEVKIKWPNCDIAPASIMKKRVRTREWNTVVAKILSFGGMYISVCTLCIFKMVENIKKIFKYVSLLVKRLAFRSKGTRV